ncbi:pyridoxal-phosphate dependent enzyme [Nonomuraea basaltis]|uniref:pyridoxal-phosphate dependent enzyme n=1 Tax=Nonomuraea basaltis TaxID=2495887 RepID=UPI0023F44065|nr:pyridoxal-phosphate dependent enzyme [Nonomuraea basaltis]
MDPRATGRARARLLGQARRPQPRRHQGPPGAPHDPPGPLPRRARPGAPVIESTSGTLGLGLALAGIVYGHPVTLVSDPGMEPLMHRLLSAYGTRIEVVTRPHLTGGWQEARRERVRDLLGDNPGAYCPDQYHNPDNVSAYDALARPGKVVLVPMVSGSGEVGGNPGNA